MSARIVLCTVPEKDVGSAIARTLVEEKLAACVNLMPDVRSIYAWEGKVQDDPEVLMVIKTSARRYEQLEQRILDLHPYDTPEVVSLAADQVSAAYMDWIIASTTP